MGSLAATGVEDDYVLGSTKHDNEDISEVTSST